jgi:hypothetical protein
VIVPLPSLTKRKKARENWLMEEYQRYEGEGRICVYLLGSRMEQESLARFRSDSKPTLYIYIVD